jgi:hypothetical protein
MNPVLRSATSVAAVTIAIAGMVTVTLIAAIVGPLIDVAALGRPHVI